MEKIKIGKFFHLRFKGDWFNCKFSSFDNIQRCLQNYEKETIKAIKEKTEREHTWFCTVNNMKYVDILKKHFIPIYIQRVPIGYDGGHQYHCLFRGGMNTYSKRLDKARPKKINDKILTKILTYKSKTWLKKYLIKHGLFS